MESDASQPFIQATVLALLVTLEPSYLFLTYGTKIAEDSKTKISKETATIILGIAQLLGTSVASVFIDTKGRKFLLNLSLGGGAVCLITMATHLYLHRLGFSLAGLHWIPVFCMAMCVLFAAVGIIPLRMICLVESFPIKLRPVGVTFGNISMNVFLFIIVKLYPLLVEIIKTEGCMLFFGITCALGVIYVVMCVKETKGKELNVVKNKDEFKPNSIHNGNEPMSQVTRL